MQKTKLIQVLKSFTNAEIKSFKEFCRSPYFNKNKNITRLCDILAGYHPEFDAKTLVENKVFTKVYLGEEYNYSKLKNLTSDLLMMCFEFLKINSRDGLELRNEIKLLKELRIHGLINLYRKKVEQTGEHLGEIRKESEELLLTKYFYEDEKVNSTIIDSPAGHLEQIKIHFESFLRFVLFRILKFYNSQLHESNQNSFNYDFKLMNEILNFLENDTGYNIPIIELYRKMILLQLHKKEETYTELKMIFNESRENLDEADSFLAYIILNGFCANRHNIFNDRKYIKEAYSLMKTMYLYGKPILGKLLYPDFVHYVKTFSRARDFKLAEQFMNEWQEELPPEEKENCLNFSYALISYLKGNAEKALFHSSSIHFSSFIMKVQAKLLHMQILYSLGLYEQMRSAIDSFRHFAAKEKSLTEIYRTAMQDFLRLIVNLAELNETNDLNERKTLTQIFLINLKKMNANPFGIKMWLEDQIENFEPVVN